MKERKEVNILDAHMRLCRRCLERFECVYQGSIRSKVKLDRKGHFVCGSFNPSNLSKEDS